MTKLTETEIERIVDLLRQGKPLPDDYKGALFEAKKEYELVYADKEREEDILVNTMAVPVQKVKTFRNGRAGNGWTNILVFGDNLQVLKTLLEMKHEGKLKNANGLPGIKLIYIDPPFSTKQDFRGSQDQKAYQDKIAGAKFLEFLRKRLVFLKELLSLDGGMFVHLDYRKKHYVKALMDEIFDENNFRNEIAVSRVKKNIRERERVKKLNEEFDTILFYSRNDSLLVLPPTWKNAKPDRWHAFDAAGFRTGMDYEIFGFKPAPNRHWHWTKEKAFEAKSNYEKWAAELSQTESLGDYWLRTGEKLEFVRPHPNTGKPEYFIPASEESLCNNLWNDIPAYSFSFNYPTEKSEILLARIINMASDPSDIVLDCFSGSGTTLAVAEKLNRRWIGVDCGKLAIYTTQKRLLDIDKSKECETFVKKYGRRCTPFALYNAGLYDYKMIKDLPWEQYRSFALKLFQCRDEKHEISNIELDGYLGEDNVLVFNYQKYKDALMDRGYIDDLHQYLADKIGKRFFIIAPAASVRFLEDYLDKGKTRYFVLRIPYSIIEEIHQQGFTKIKQPASEMDINDTVDVVGFDFIQVPIADCRYFMDKTRGQLELGEDMTEYVVKIERFESKVISRKPVNFANYETLSMVMLDYDFDGETFDLDEVLFSDELQKNNYEVRIPQKKVKGQLLIIYVDIFGNERRELKTKEDFIG
jgi:site-specific DNA-methyltransferase (adenine-specific)/adenine-specific DNA-methyltransferase